MKRNLLLATICSLVSMSALAHSSGLAENVCEAKNGTYIKFLPESINLDYIKASDGKLESALFIKDPSPVLGGVVYLDNNNSSFKKIIIDAVNDDKSLSLCLTSNGDIFAATVNGSNL
ncbi:TPA: hypothetical protein ACX6S8_000876 [Photobacterium damselae]|uniref:hypothetical protein n=1 Tax=Photobacterium damselae TaxID=38293 RepID=UPI001593B546|nr:hypothetical protein [Photobacterium damselae]NVH48458.1 hypothetical protein [Photobacterium damselae subsp. damselae]